MEITIANAQKRRLETIDIEFTDQNTTWFDDVDNHNGIYMITDIKGCLLISEWDYSFPILISDKSRKDINYDPKKARELKNRYELSTVF
jgi:prophage tail gpP-like protein